MKIFILIPSMFAASVVTTFSAAAAEPVVPNAPAAATTVVVHGVMPAAVIAPSWKMGRVYKFGDLANYDGIAYRAKSGSAHKRPGVAYGDGNGWEALNACDDKSKGAVQCEWGNQAEVTSTESDAKLRLRDVLVNMSKGDGSGAGP